MTISDIAKAIKKGDIGVIPTDTIYGIVGSALNRKAVERIYKVRKRDLKKPLIILISKIGDLGKFKIDLPRRPGIRTGPAFVLKKVWPGKVSVILPCRAASLRYLHRGTNSLAFRLPKDGSLINLLKKTGPLVAPSANPEGLPPAINIKKAKEYFGLNSAFYLDKGPIKGKPSSIFKYDERTGSLIKIR